MKLILSSAMKKIFSIADCFEIKEGKCLKNESFQFQVYVEAEEAVIVPVSVLSDVGAKLYVVKKIKGDYYIDKVIDDYYVFAEDHMYPELLQDVETLTLTAGESATLFVDVPAQEKSVGVHKITVSVGENEVVLPLTVMDTVLPETDLYIAHWFHVDGICNYYGLKPFTKEFYIRFEQFLNAYVKMGNNMVLVPVFTPPLDTQVGGERLTTQLVKVKKVGESYEFDLSQLDYYIDFVQAHGIKYFEFSHLFSQWGGEYCPKIMVEADGEEKNLFGWNVSSESEEYKAFLKAYLTVFTEYVEKKGIKERSVMHLTDEPHAEHVERYTRLSEYVKQYNGGVKICDALSDYSFAKNGAVDLPVVCTGSAELEKFQDRKHLVYYCIGVDGNYLSNRYFHMPLQRTQILGFQINGEQVNGFLQWGYNFYNTQLSTRVLNPYEETTAGGNFCAGDSFIVYPGEKTTEYSLRFFAMVKAFEDYRLMKAVENKLGREKTLDLLKAEGVEGMHVYPRSVEWHESFRAKLYALL